MPAVQAIGSTFVGRERELAALQTAVEAAIGGRGRCILIAGEPGIGKTRTAQEVAARAEKRGTTVLWGRCHEADGAPPFWPWSQLLDGVLRTVDTAEQATWLNPLAPELAQLIPVLGERAVATPAFSPDSLDARFRLFDAVARFLDQAAGRKPLVLIVDDLHGADVPSLLLLQFLTRRLRDMRVLIVGTFRDVALSREHPLQETIAQLIREPLTERYQLGGWNVSEVTRFIAATTSAEPAPSLVAQLHARTEGNPLFVSEYLRLQTHLRHASDVSPISGVIPDTVRTVIARRIAPLPKQCRDTLRVAAVIGRVFSEQLLASVLPAVDGNPAQTGYRNGSRSLHQAQEAAVISEVADARGHYRFLHSLIRETLYDEIDPVERASLHHRVGKALERSANAEVAVAPIKEQT